MILTHYPAGPQPETWRFDTSRVYAQTRGADNKPCWQALKPRGLWLSYDTGPSVGWAEWCADNVPDWVEEAMRVFLRQLERFRRGEPLRDVIDKAAGY